MYLRDKKEKKKTVAYAAIGAAILVLAFVFYPFSFGGSPNVSFAARALWIGERSVLGAISAAFETLSSKRKLVVENEELRRRVYELEVESLSSSFLRKEYEYLLERTGRMDDDTLVLAGVLARPNRSPYDTIILDAGSVHGVSEGDLVLGYGSVALGEIREVFEHSSRAVLFSTPGTETEVLLASPRIAVTLVGRGGGTFEMILSRDAEVVAGTELLFPGAEPLLVGTVEKVISDPRDPFQRALAAAIVPLSELDVVFIRTR